MNEETEVTSPPLKKPKVDNENITPEIKTKKEVDHDMEVNEDKVDPDINSFVNSDDIQKLREFKVLDEVKSNEEDSNAEDSDSSDDNSEGLPEEEIEKMLEEDLPEGFKAGPTKPKARPYVTRTKTVLEEKGVNQFEVLPIDWMTVRHQSGMPVYLHKGTRVCTLSKPYFIGKGNIKRHDIPISAIPCLAYKRALEEDEKQKEMDRKLEEQIKNLSQKVTKQNIGNKPEGNEKKGQLLFPGKTSGAGDNHKNRCPFKHLREQTENSDKMKDENDLMETDTDKENTREIKGGTASTSTGLNDNDTGGQFKRPAELDFTDDLIVHNETKSENTTITSVNATESSDKKEMNTEGINEAGLSATKDEVSAGGSGEKSDNKANISDVLSDMQIPINRRPVVLPSGEIIPAPRVESVNNSWKTQCLTPEQFNDYCKKLFKFKSVNVLQFNRWADRRKYAKAKKTMQFPKLPEGTKLITIPVNSGQDGNGGKGAKRDWVMNMNGGSYLSVFHEYVCRALQKQPVYEYKQLENAQAPYQATVYIGGMQYGVGHGTSKRQAKYAAARASIHILIPEMREYLDAPPSENNADPDFGFFDYVTIEDPRIAEFCAATCEPSPHAILRTCLLRNFGASDRHIHTEMKKIACQEIELTMKVGKHSATVVCKNKKTAKQRASQSILQALHPHVRSWGSLLRLYGSKSVKSCKEKKLEEQQITLLQDKARHNEPNYAVLEKLRNEMRKLKERDEAVVPIGTLLVTNDLPTHSGSNLNNVDL